MNWPRTSTGFDEPGLTVEAMELGVTFDDDRLPGVFAGVAPPTSA